MLARARLRCRPIFLTIAQARTVVEAIARQAEYRACDTLAVAVMANHVHIVVGAPGDPSPGSVLHRFKSYASRALNAEFGRPASGTWWTQSGSTRLPKQEANAIAAMRYVRDRAYPLAVRVDGRAWGERR